MAPMPNNICGYWVAQWFRLNSSGTRALKRPGITAQERLLAADHDRRCHDGEGAEWEE